MARQVLELKYDWKFCKGEIENAETMSFDDGNFKTVRVPHDWAIEGPFDPENDLQFKEVVADAIGKTEHIGRTGALPIVGEAWYRKNINIPETFREKEIFIQFDGVMSNSTVYMNGKAVGTRPYGYSSFIYNITEQINIGEENIIVVKASPEECASRWYPGAGIYRPVYLIAKEKTHIEHWGNYITTPSISEKEAVVRIETKVVNGDSAVCQVKIIDADNSTVATTETMVSGNCIVNELTVDNPTRWSINTPYLYKVVVTIIKDGKVCDCVEENFGIRTFCFDDNEGFFLNDEYMKLNGVCMHHDLGALGTAVNKRAIERQLEILKEMGCNAIRTSHNPPSVEYLDACDRMGFVVIDEAFDEWKYDKVINGYHKYFEEWAERDLTDMILRDRNHPCIIMWSIGNEIMDQYHADGSDTTRWLSDICHHIDNTRPTTAGFNCIEEAIHNKLVLEVDLIGVNYKPFLYKHYKHVHPEWKVYGSETESYVSSRGKYYFPIDLDGYPCEKQDDLHMSSYDVSGPMWACSPETEFEAQDKNKQIYGEFVWTGFDYLGEPTPYRREWPSRSSYFGIVDMCGIPKDRYYSYQAKWTDKEVLHVFPHWTFPERIGKVTPVHCYTSYLSAELFINGKSQGVVKKHGDTEFTRYRLMWNDAVYEPGEIKVVAFDESGEIAKEVVVKTAGEEAQITLEPDQTIIKADGDDLSCITLTVQDKDGNVCPNSDTRFTINVEGCGELIAVDNGDQTSLEPFQQNTIKAFSGKCMLFVRSIQKEIGEIKITAAARDIEKSVCIKAV